MTCAWGCKEGACCRFLNTWSPVHPSCWREGCCKSGCPAPALSTWVRVLGSFWLCACWRLTLSAGPPTDAAWRLSLCGGVQPGSVQQAGTRVPRRLWADVGRARVCMPFGVWPTLWLSCPHPALVQRDPSLHCLVLPSERGQEQGGARCELWACAASPARGFCLLTVCRFRGLRVMSSGAASW